MSEIHKGDPYAAWAGAEKRLSNAMDTIHELRAALAAKDAELAALRQERDELRAVVEAARGLLRAVDGFGPVGSVYEKRNELAAALERVNGKGEK